MSGLLIIHLSSDVILFPEMRSRSEYSDFESRDLLATNSLPEIDGIKHTSIHKPNGSNNVFILSFDPRLMNYLPKTLDALGNKNHSTSCVSTLLSHLVPN